MIIHLDFWNHQYDLKEYYGEKELDLKRTAVLEDLLNHSQSQIESFMKKHYPHFETEFDFSKPATCLKPEGIIIEDDETIILCFGSDVDPDQGLAVTIDKQNHLIVHLMDDVL